MMGIINAFRGRKIRGYADFIQGLANCFPSKRQNFDIFAAIFVTLMPFTEEGRRRLHHPYWVNQIVPPKMRVRTSPDEYRKQLLRIMLIYPDQTLKQLAGELNIPVVVLQGRILS